MKSNKILFKSDPGYSRCPSCASLNSLHRSRSRSWRETVVKSLSIYKIYRCGKCGWRGYQKTLVITRTSIRNLFLYLSMALIAGYIVIQYLKSYVE